MFQIYQTFFYQPIFNLLVWLVNVIPGNDIGIAIILLTIIIKGVLFPFSLKSIRSQRTLQQLQPKVEALRKKYGNKKEEMAQELMKLYRTEKVNPLSSCLPLLIQLPFFIAVYRVFISGLTNGSFDLLYPFIENPGTISPVTLGFFDLSKPNIILALITGAAQFFQTKMMVGKRQPNIPGAGDERTMAAMNKQMTYMMPAITVIIGISLPAGLILYWFVTTLLMIAQQHYTFKTHPAEKPAVVEGEVVEMVEKSEGKEE
ncbi:MAG: hypothetical protein COT81_04255 [Candidatus Buchananbacteria bacterium CG10_big_fil_rev_8_21_14_0_10_42_9]|uniref:Membrane insertase YidC/Oxa/ALB C-terminal domain-containing protein n=1 Tax=Candidatus Buchananbacteria bacterium CG10_big_fil_rev_8_21_14_0_10_42_9 TaxID=1974526 RepID=A0A2H0W2V6_9BACT|nr:MAG: hypothetical protein COT81_04255 [Candidatus Buchananbacteria bacterium CG10_big_fil_rev_8_21_14_0_10_42_9]